MIDISPVQILIVLAIALIVFGPSRLPEMGRSVGRGIREFRGAISSSEPEASPAGAPAEPAHEAGRPADEDDDLEGMIVPGDRRPGASAES